MGDMISQDEMNELLSGMPDDNSGIEHDIIHDFLDDIKTYLGYYITDENLSFEYKNISNATLNDVKQYSGSEVVGVAVEMETLEKKPFILLLKQYDAKNIIALLNGTDLSEVEDGPILEGDIDVLKSLIDAVVTPIGTLINKFTRKIILKAPTVLDLPNSSELTSKVEILDEGYFQADYTLNSSEIKDVTFTFYFPEELIQILSERINEEGHTFLNGKKIEKNTSDASVQAQGLGGNTMQGSMENQQFQSQQQMMNNMQQMNQPYGQNMNNINAQNAEFQQLAYTDVIQQRENISLIREVPLEVTIEMGRTKKKIRDILEFSPGTIIELDKTAGDSIDILANGKFIAKGEVVVIDENYGVRITEILGKQELL